MKPSTILKKARKLIERGWCRGSYALDAKGRAVDMTSNLACRWCMSGALWRAGGMSADTDAARAFARMAIGDDHGILDFNDSRRNRLPVLHAFDRAIKLAQGEGQ